MLKRSGNLCNPSPCLKKRGVWDASCTVNQPGRKMISEPLCKEQSMLCKAWRWNFSISTAIVSVQLCSKKRNLLDLLVSLILLYCNFISYLEIAVMFEDNSRLLDSGFRALLIALFRGSLVAILGNEFHVLRKFMPLAQRKSNRKASRRFGADSHSSQNSDDDMNLKGLWYYRVSI